MLKMLRDRSGDRREMEERKLDDILSTLVENALQQPEGSRERKLAIAKLTHELFVNQKFRVMKRMNKTFTKYQPPLREQLIEEAINECVLYLFGKGLNEYKPEKGKLMNWVSIKLDYHGGFVDKICSKNVLFGDLNRQQRYVSTMTHKELETSDFFAIYEEEFPKKLLNIIREDKDGRFRNETMRNYPDVNWRDLALKRSEGKKWAQIAEEDYRDLNVRPTALSNFFFARQEREPLSLILADYGVRRRRTRNRNN